MDDDLKTLRRLYYEAMEENEILRERLREEGIIITPTPQPVTEKKARPRMDDWTPKPVDPQKNTAHTEFSESRTMDEINRPLVDHAFRNLPRPEMPFVDPNPCTIDDLYPNSAASDAASE